MLVTAPILVEPDTVGIVGECPLDHTSNVETRAAIEEGRAMMRGEIPCKRYTSLGEFFKDLKS
jgi:hypothetical protein